MPEHQASSSPTPPPPHSNKPSRDDTTRPLPENAKRTYLSLLPPPQLIDLILAFDADRQTVIFPHDLDSAIKALQRSRRSPSPLATDRLSAVAVVAKAESAPTSISPTPPGHTENTLVPPPVHPPQYVPPTHYYPYSHTPYYPPPVQHPQPQTHVSPPAAPPRNPLFTSAPLHRDPNKPLVHPPPAPVTSRDDPNAMPSYEEMIVSAIMDVGELDGTAPKVLFAWMASHYPLQQNFRPSASQALHKAFKRGRLEKLGGKYRLNPSWGGGPTTSKRATRRPTAHPPRPPPLHLSATPYAQPPPHPHYNFPPYVQPHSSLPSHATAPPQPVPWHSHSAMGEDGEESEDMEGQEDGDIQIDAGEDESAIKKSCAGGAEEIRCSLLRLVKVLKNIARKGDAG